MSATIEETLRAIWRSGDRNRLLTDEAYFLSTLAERYQPQFKADCKLMERGIRAGAGKIVLQFLNQGRSPSAAELGRFREMMQVRAGFEAYEAQRIIDLLSGMVGWTAQPQPQPGPRPRPNPAPKPRPVPTPNSTKQELQIFRLIYSVGILLIVIGIVGQFLALDARSGGMPVDMFGGGISMLYAEVASTPEELFNLLMLRIALARNQLLIFGLVALAVQGGLRFYKDRTMPLWRMLLWPR